MGAEERFEELEQRVEALEAMLKDMILRMPLGSPAAVEEAPRSALPSSRALPSAGRYLVVGLGIRLFGLPLEGIREVVRNVELKALPGAPPAFEGMLDLRGEPIVVIDLRLALGEEALADDLDSKIVIWEWEGTIRFAFKVDEVLRVEEVDGKCISAVPEFESKDYVLGVARLEAMGELLILLDPSGLRDTLIHEERVDIQSVVSLSESEP